MPGPESKAQYCQMKKKRNEKEKRNKLRKV
jgi:hypothetical protein